MSPAPDEPLIPPPPSPNVRAGLLLDGKVERWIDDQQSVLSEVPLTDAFRLPD